MRKASTPSIEFTEQNTANTSLRNGNELRFIRNQLRVCAERPEDIKTDPKVFVDRAVVMIDRALEQMARYDVSLQELAPNRAGDIFNHKKNQDEDRAKDLKDKAKEDNNNTHNEDRGQEQEAYEPPKVFEDFYENHHNEEQDFCQPDFYRPILEEDEEDQTLQAVDSQNQTLDVSRLNKSHQTILNVYPAESIFRESRVPLNSHFLEKIGFEVEKLENHHDKGAESLIGDNLTHIAVKSPVSYLIATKEKGLKLFDIDSEVYSGRLPIHGAWLTDMIYIEPLDCYLLNHHHKIFRKDIDGRPPRLFMDVKCGYRVGASFRYSEVHDRLIVNKDNRKIAAINLEEKKVEFELRKRYGDDINDFKLSRKKEDKVVAITKNGQVLLYILDFEKKTGSVVSHSSIELLKERFESGKSISLCSRNKHILVEIGQFWTSFICSRMVVFSIEDNKLVKKAVIDQYSQKIGSKYALEYYGYAGTHALWIGLSWNTDGQAHLFDYDDESGEFKELEEKRVAHQERDPAKIVRLGNQFYYSGHGGKVMRLCLTV